MVGPSIPRPHALLVERGLHRIGARDGFGMLLAAGLAFSVALQCFVVVGGVTRSSRRPA